MKKFLKGMHKDAERVDMPEGTYRDALNANLYYTKGSIVNEQGNTLVGEYLPPNFPIQNIIGQCALQDGRILVCAIDTNPDTNGNNVISLVTPKQNKYEVLYRNNDLNFQVNYTIEATAKIDSKNKIKVYLTDNYISKIVEPSTGIEYIDEYNPPRVFDVSKQLEYLSTLQTVTTADQTVLYSATEDYTIDKLDIFMNSGFIPEFTDIEIVEGGGVLSGTYHLALAYVDEDRNVTNFLVASNAVHIVTANEDALPTESITGDPQGSQSNKSITWNFTIPETARNYTFLKPIVIQRFGGGQNQETSEFAYVLDIVKIEPGEEQSVTYTGLETVAQASVSEVIIDYVRYETAKTFVQLDNRLYISNLKSRGDIGYQRFANSISLRAITEEIERFDPRHFDVININKGYTNLLSTSTQISFTQSDTISNIYKPIQGNDHEDLTDNQIDKFSGRVRKGYKDIKLSYKKKSYRRSEVYAFYISFVLKDGTETYAYHIPGRNVLQINNIGASDYFENLSIIDHSASDLENAVGLNTAEIIELYENAKLHQIADTQVILSEVAGIEVSTSYWENNNELYPNSNDFTVWSTNLDGTPTQIGDIRNQRVRHHKMPSNKHPNYSFIPGIQSWDSANSNAVNQFSPNLFELNNDNQDLELAENIRLLGVQLENIHIPRFILKQVQGYKIYYAKRQQKDKTIIGQSVPVPSALRANTVLSMYTPIAKFGPYNRAWWMYGGVPPASSYYPNIVSKFNNSAFYRGFSVFKFHDFNLLKNKHGLAGASHIDVQSILTFRYYAGGPGSKDRPVPDDNSHTFSNTEWGPNEEIGNTSFPNDPDNQYVAGIRAWATSVFIAAGYHEPRTAAYSPQFFLTNPVVANRLDNIQSIYTLQPKSVTYLPGSTHLESTDAGAFHGARYLLNFAGESAIAVGLSSGLPMLVGFLLNAPTNDRPNVDGGFWWYPENGWLNPENGGTGNFNWVLNINNPYLNTSSTSSVGGHPAAYLINLCSIKENVYDSFDEQQLVWTGYYKSLRNVNEETGEDLVESNNYYQGAQSNEIFGGDTYITRYGFRSTVLSYGHHNFTGGGTLTDIPFNLSTGFTGGTQVWPTDFNDADTILSTDEADTDLGFSYRWGIGNNSPVATIFYFYCESEDLIGYRHSADTQEGVLEKDGRFFDGSVAASVLFKSPVSDGTNMDNMLYMNNYSSNQDLKVAIPLPKNFDNVSFFPTRTIRSDVDEGRLDDRYRKYQALEFKDVPKNRGDIWDIFTLGSVLYIHTENSLFVTKGKENLQLADASQAFIGSGDIFSQDPDELLSTTEGYGGTDAQFASITTRYGHFFVNRKYRKVFLMTQQLEEISSYGMEKWFTDNLQFKIEEFGVDLDLYLDINTDAPTNYFGFTAGYDPKFKRILLTKVELLPTPLFISLFNNNLIQVVEGVMQFPITYQGEALFGELTFENTNFFTRGGWTLSYYPEYKFWGSRHSYIPRIYSYTTAEYYSLINLIDSTEGQIWEHSNLSNPGRFYNELYNFEFEYIDNSSPGASKIFSSIFYWTEIQTNDIVNTSQIIKHTSPGFTSFYVYNTQQISGQAEPINYLNNVRLVDKFWYINDFRDLSLITTLTTTDLVTNLPNVQELFTQGVDAPTQALTMFTEEGVINPNYIDTSKQWYEQRRFVDHYLGVRLICNNLTGNLVHLYAAGAKFRNSFR